MPKTNNQACLKLFVLGISFFQSGALLGKTKSIPRDKTSTICLKLFYLDFFFQSGDLFSNRHERDARTSRDAAAVSANNSRLDFHNWVFKESAI
jgi:hypothetical protein